MIELACFSDGGCNNITKTNAYGSFKILSDKEEVVKRLYYDSLTSSNEAEYETMIRLLSYLMENYSDDTPINIFADSKLVVMQINKKWEVRDSRMKEFHSVASGLFSQFKNIKLIWVPRNVIVKQLGH